METGDRVKPVETKIIRNEHGEFITYVWYGAEIGEIKTVLQNMDSIISPAQHTTHFGA